MKKRLSWNLEIIKQKTTLYYEEKKKDTSWNSNNIKKNKNKIKFVPNLHKRFNWF